MTHRIFKIVLLTACTGVAVVLNGCKCWPDQSNREAGVPRLKYQPQDLSVTNTGDENAVFQFEVKNDNSESLEYQWFSLVATNCCQNETNETMNVAEVILSDKTNNFLAFTNVVPSDYGLYFCQILNHPPVDKPPYGAVRETRTRVVSLSGPATHLHYTRGILDLANFPIPLVGIVRGGSAGQNSCGTSSAYVNIPDSGSLTPDPSNAGTCILTLTNNAGIYPNTKYKEVWYASVYPGYGCMSPTTTNTYCFKTPLPPNRPAQFFFTVLFNSSVPTGTKVTNWIAWKP
jgi:hypothetical protein